MSRSKLSNTQINVASSVQTFLSSPNTIGMRQNLGMVNSVLVPPPTGNAVTDTANITSALSSITVNTRTVEFSSGTYVCNNILRIANPPNNLVINGNGCTIHHTDIPSDDPVSGGGWRMQMVIRGQKELPAQAREVTGPVNAGAMTIDYIGSGIVAGDLLVLGSNDQFAFHRPVPQNLKGEFVRVASVSGNTITLVSPTKDSYTTNIRLQKVTAPSGIIMRDFTFTNSMVGVANGPLRPVGLILEQLQNLRVENITISGNVLMRTGIYLFDSINVSVDTCRFSQVADSTRISNTEGYGIYVIGSEDVVVSNIWGFEDRHTIDAGSFFNSATGWRPITRNLLFRNIVAKKDWSSGLSTHAGADGVTLDGFLAEDCGGGVIFRSKNNKIRNGKVIGGHRNMAPTGKIESYVDGLRFGEPIQAGGSGVPGTGIAGEGLIIENVEIDLTTTSGGIAKNTNRQEGIRLENGPIYGVISNVSVKGYSAHGIQIAGPVDGLTIRDVTFDGALQLQGPRNASPIAVLPGNESLTRAGQTPIPVDGLRVRDLRICNVTVLNHNNAIPVIRILGGFNSTTSVSEQITIENISVIAGDQALPVANTLPVVQLAGGFFNDVSIKHIRGSLPTPIQIVSGASVSSTTASGAVINRTSASQDIRPFDFYFHCDAGSNFGLTSSPQAARLAANSSRSVRPVTLNGHTQVRMVSVVSVNSASPNNPQIELLYKTGGFSSTFANFSSIGVLPVVNSLSTQGFRDSGWINLVPDAQGEIFLALAESGGDGVISPALGYITFMFR